MLHQRQSIVTIASNALLSRFAAPKSMQQPMLRLLGGIDWPRPDAAESPGVGRKPRALLALAAASGQRGIARERLAGLLWPELEASAGASALRQSLHLLRRALGETATVIDARRDRIGLHPEFVDVFAFEALAARDDVESLCSAARLYRGDFCDGFAPAEDEVAREIESERARLRQLAHRVAGRIASGASERAPIELGIDLARRVLARDPLQEACFRTLMELLARAGMRAEALGAYDEFRETLRRELAIEPSPETVAVAESLRAARPATIGTATTEFAAGAAGPNAPLAPGAALPAASRSTSPVARVPADDDHQQAAPRRPPPVTVAEAMRVERAIPAAADQLLRAWSLLRRPTAENMRLAREAAETAVRIDRGFVGAIVLQGWTHWYDWVLGWSDAPDETWRRAVDLADHALALESEDATPRMLRAMLCVRERRHDLALEHALVATRVAPDLSYSHYHLGAVHTYSGRHAEALVAFRRAHALDADDIGAHLHGEAVALFMLGELEHARQLAERAITRNPGHPLARIAAAAIYSDLGLFELARAEARFVAGLCPKWRYGTFLLEQDNRRFPEAWARIGFALEPERGLPPGGKIVQIGANNRRSRGFGS